jgi:hypothetical protein
VSLDGKDVYGLACGQHVVFAVPVGERIVGARRWPDESTTAVTVSVGSRSYLQLNFFGSSGPVLTQITPEIGERLMRETDAQSVRPPARL